MNLRKSSLLAMLVLSSTFVGTSMASLSDSDFGPGNSSDFALSSSVRGYVVGVYGLTASDFVKRSDGFRAFVDDRIVDIEKHSGSDAPDHQSCSEYSDLDCLFWTGWASQLGYATEDSLAEAYLNGSKDYSTLAAQVDDIWEDVVFSDVQGLVSKFSDADGFTWMCVDFENYNWYGEVFDQIGHAVVCCGYAYDKTKSWSDPTCLQGLFIIDPDNDREEKGGGASAPDSITYCPVSWNASKGKFMIKGVFGAVGYISSGDLLRAPNTPVRRKFVESESEPVPSPPVDQPVDLSAVTRIYSQVRTDKTYFYTWVPDADSSAVGVANDQEVDDQEVDDGDLGDEDDDVDYERGFYTAGGLAAVKISKVNKKGQVKIMVKLSPFFGASSSVAKVVSPNAEGEIDTSIELPGYGLFYFWAGECDDGSFDYEVYKAGDENIYFGGNDSVLGGAFATDKLVFSFNSQDVPTFSGKDVITAALPTDYSFNVWGGTQWIFGSRAKLSWAKDGATINALTTYSSGWSLVIDHATALLGNDNYSGLTLAYKPSTGLFQGSFRIFYTNAGYTKNKPKVKAVKAIVRGVVIKDEDFMYGMGMAGIKIGSTVYTWPVYVELPSSEQSDEDDWEDSEDWEDSIEDLIEE